MIKRLWGWCQKVIPLAYDDSLSYAEVLAKVTAKTNEIIDTINKTGDDINNALQSISGKYTKPAGGIPKSDLASGVIPDHLPNPHALTINGTRYDGSEAVSVTVQGGGGSGGTVDAYTKGESDARFQPIGDYLQFYKIGYDGDRLYHIEDNGARTYLSYNDVRAKFENDSIFLYLNLDNLIYIPSIDVPNSTITAIAFSCAWTRSEDVDGDSFDQPYISRLIINSNNDIRYIQIGAQDVDMKFNSVSDLDGLSDPWLRALYPSGKVISDIYSGFDDTIKNRLSAAIGDIGYVGGIYYAPEWSAEEKERAQIRIGILSSEGVGF